MSFYNQVVLITGASSGIGAAAAIEFAKNAASLVLVGRNLENLQKTADQCKFETTPIPLLVIADVTDEEAVKGIIDKTLAKYGRLDVLVNNAGVIENGSIENTSLEQYDRIMNTNVRSVYQLTALAVPELIKTKGNIINISSVCGLRSFPGVLSYAVSKAAIDQFTRCTALELAPKGVRVNAVNPGVIVTDLHKRGGMSDETYKVFIERCKQTHPLGRPGEADEVAKAICFLASDMASFSTGVTLPVDGGKHALCPR